MPSPSRTTVNSWVLFTTWIATLLFWGALLAFATALDGYSQMMHPVALLGAHGTPRALAFNVLGFLLPGLLLALMAWRLRAAMPDSASWPARIGVRLVLLSALAFALQGVLPLDPQDLEADASRLHAAAWMLWWVAGVAAIVFYAAGAWRDHEGRAWAMLSLLAAALLACLPLLAMSALVDWPPPVTERCAFAMWFVWLLLLSRHEMRRGIAQARNLQRGPEIPG